MNSHSNKDNLKQTNTLSIDLMYLTNYNRQQNQTKKEEIVDKKMLFFIENGYFSYVRIY